MRMEEKEKSRFISCACFLLHFLIFFVEITCWCSWSQALHASPWWHSVSQWSSYCSQHSRPHKALTLYPAIWHCLTKDTNIYNWIQPVSEPILRKDNMMFSEFSEPASQSWIGAHSFSKQVSFIVCLFCTKEDILYVFIHKMIYLTYH